MENNASVILAIFIAAVIMFGYPLVATAQKTDKAAQGAVESSTYEYTNTIQKTGKLTINDYQKFADEISATGNAFNIEIELQVIDENASKKAQSSNGTIQNKSTYTTYYTTQVMEMINSNNGTLNLKSGDIIKVTVSSENPTIFDQIAKMFGKNNVTATIQATASGVVN